MDTPLTLLDRLRGQSELAWQELCKLYEPLIRHWLRRDPALGPEEDDLVQEVLVAVFRSLAGFSRERSGAFQAWLRTITLNCLNAYWRKRQRRPVAVGGPAADLQLTQLENPASELSQEWDRDHNQHIIRYLLEVVRPKFEPATWQAFWRVEMEGQKPGAVATELGLSVAAVYLAKSRVLKRLREMGRGLLD